MGRSAVDGSLKSEVRASLRFPLLYRISPSVPNYGGILGQLMTGPRKLFILVFCWLLLLAGVVPFQSKAFAQDAGGPQLQRPAPQPDLLPVNGRVLVQPPKAPLRLGEKNALDLVLHGPAPRLIDLSQSQGEGDREVGIEGSDEQATLQQRSDGSTYVNVTPIALGRVKFSVWVDFADGGYEREDVAAQVVAAQPPVKVEMPPAGMIQMDLSRFSRATTLLVQATYPGFRRPLQIEPRDVQFEVRQDRGPEAIHFDPATGKILALHVGHALIVVHYGGVTLAKCVIVAENAQAPDGSYCNELRPGGSRVLPTLPGADAPGAAAGSKLPYRAMDSRHGRFVADDRVDVQVASMGLELARDTEVDFMLRGPAVAEVRCSIAGQSSCGRGTDNSSGFRLPLTRHGDGRVTVNVFPAALGDVEYTFEVLFVDGGVALKKVKAEVAMGRTVPTSVGPNCFPLGSYDYHPIRLVAPKDGVKQYPGEEDLFLSACFDGLRGAVRVIPQFVNFAVKTEGPAPVAQVVQSTGKVSAVAPGQALVIEEFGGRQWARCVVVMPADAPYEHNLSNCRVLRAQYGFPLPPLQPRNTPNIQGSNAADTQKQMTQVFSIEDGQVSPDVKDPFNADDRLQIPIEGVSLVLGQPAKLPLRLTGPGVLETVEYAQQLEATGIHSVGMREENVPSPLMLDDHGNLVVRVVAHQLGTATFRFVLLFADGGVATRSVHLPVKLPDHPPLRLINALELGNRDEPLLAATTLHLVMQPPDNTRQLWPVAWFGEQSEPVAIQPQEASFSVKTAGPGPVIQLDATTGEVTAVRIGHALVRTEFDGAASETCVVVMQNSTDGDSSNCEELRGAQR